MHLQSGEGVQFTRTHHVVRKTTLYDMDVEPSWKYTAIGCQDRNIRWVGVPFSDFFTNSFSLCLFCGKRIEPVGVRTTFRSGLSLTRTWVLEVRLSHQSRQQAPLSSELFFWPPLVRFLDHIPLCSSVSNLLFCPGFRASLRQQSTLPHLRECERVPRTNGKSHLLPAYSLGSGPQAAVNTCLPFQDL